MPFDYNPESPHQTSFSVTPGGIQRITSETLTRPADTTAYAQYDLVANSTTAGSVVATEIKNAVRRRTPQEALRIEQIRLRKSGTSLTNASFRVYILQAQPGSFSVGDNAQLNTSGALGIDTIVPVVGWFDVVMDRSATAGAQGIGVSSNGNALAAKPTAGTSLWFIIEASAAYTPASGETFVVDLEGQWA